MSLAKNAFSVAGYVVVLCAVQSVCQPILPVTQDPHLMIECAPRGGYVQHHLEEATAYVRTCVLTSLTLVPPGDAPEGGDWGRGGGGRRGETGGKGGRAPEIEAEGCDGVPRKKG